MIRRFTALLISWTYLAACIPQACEAGPVVNEVGNFTESGNIGSALYSSQYNLLFLRDSTTDVRVLNGTTGAQLSLRAPSATGSFTDFAFSPSGRYLFVADYGGTNIGYDTPLNPSYVDRYDLQTGTWTLAQAPAIGYHIAPVDDNRVLLLGVDQWVDLTLNSFAPGSMSQLSKISPGYSGDVKYSPSLNRIYYNETGISSTYIQAYTLSGNTLTAAEQTPGEGYGGALGVLSSDGSTLYYDKDCCKGTDITKSIATFSETITAASPTVAFGACALLSIRPRVPRWARFRSLRSHGRSMQTAAMSWAVQQPSSGSTTLHHYLVLQSDLWNASGGGSWGDTSKWSLNALPDGTDQTADLSQVTLAADAMLTLDGSHTVGHIIFGDLARAATGVSQPALAVS